LETSLSSRILSNFMENRREMSSVREMLSE